MTAEQGEVFYLSFEDALEIHAAIIDATADQAAAQLRSRSKELLDDRPATRITNRRTSRVKQLCWRTGLPRPSHSSTGNRRTARVAMLTFLESTGVECVRAIGSFAAWIIDFSRGRTPQDIAEVVRQRLTSID